MNCPKCGCDDCIVVDVRPKDGNSKRRRECIGCGERFNTVEIHMEEYENLKELKRIILRMVGKE